MAEMKKHEEPSI